MAPGISIDSLYSLANSVWSRFVEIGTTRRSGESQADSPRTMEFQTHGFCRATGIVSPEKSS